MPYHVKNANYVKEYVPQEEVNQRQDLYRLAMEHYDKVIYILGKEIGIHIGKELAELLAENYSQRRAYNYIDANMYNIPWYMIYSYSGFNLHQMIVDKKSILYRKLVENGFGFKKSKIKNHMLVNDSNGHLLIATNYRYHVDSDERINEYIDFSIVKPDENEPDVQLYNLVTRFSIKIDSYYFENLINYGKWTENQSILQIAREYMHPRY